MTETLSTSGPSRESGEVPVLEVQGAVKRFGAVTALNGVDLKLHRREVVGLLGDNGAGKSTLIKSITGVHPLDEGQILIDGKPVSVRTPTEAREHGIEAASSPEAAASPAHSHLSPPREGSDGYGESPIGAGYSVYTPPAA